MAQPLPRLLTPPPPEPATYGAILGTAGLGLWAWRKRRRPAGVKGAK